MALSDSDKKKLPLIAVLFFITLGAGYYQFFYESPEISTNPNQQIAMAVADQARNRQSQSIDLVPIQTNRIETVDIASNAAPRTNTAFETLETTDANGNIVKAIIEPEPVPRGVKRSLVLTEQDKEIIQLMRSNLLTKLKNENSALKNQQNGVSSAPVNNAPSSSQSINYANQTPSVDQGFTEFETVKPTLLASGITDSQIEDSFSRVKVASIIVESDKTNAWVRIDGQLIKATQGARVGDFRFDSIKPDAVTMTLIKGNVTRTIGHTGFSVDGVVEE
ncbi:hypothetical protein [Vibrio sp. 1180_3]|uniref:hypothetical protein n=1 Tax=Vibrio sp. 1180_3 TaxID=2528832 RepID=UPI002405EE0E|nr:hypothetical protein [Vibrio sp. 1180_3]MDF9399140.1 hypothetical protein [Vibrio sp. 1180_3]